MLTSERRTAFVQILHSLGFGGAVTIDVTDEHAWQNLMTQSLGTVLPAGTSVTVGTFGTMFRVAANSFCKGKGWTFATIEDPNPALTETNTLGDVYGYFGDYVSE